MFSSRSLSIVTHFQLLDFCSHLCPQGLSLSSPSWSINMTNAASKTERASPPPVCGFTVLLISKYLLGHLSLPCLHFTSSPINNSFGFPFSCLLSPFHCVRVQSQETETTPVIFGSPRDSRRSKRSILKEISPGCSLEGLMLKLELQYFGHLMRRVASLEKTLTLEGLGAGGEGDDRGWDGWMASLTQWTWVWVNSESWWWTGRPGVLQFMGLQRVWHDWATELNWTELKASLVVQCLKLHTFNAGNTGSIPGQGTKIPHALQYSQIILKNKRIIERMEELSSGWPPGMTLPKARPTKGVSWGVLPQPWSGK